MYGAPPLSQQQIDRERKAAVTQKQVNKLWEHANKPVHPLIEGAVRAAQYIPIAAAAAAGVGVGIHKLVKHVQKKREQRKHNPKPKKKEVKRKSKR